ncbi:hypothetical protein LVY65_05055 [Sphingomonas sp. G124]|uniref:Uncharacterized protein n=1 Tax=Sphingomonas cremea TaxID=2904799 RepID=A0A9X1TVQ6_9SPHN|nr:hypothetical protein [Sphingomonas cremea]MCF2514434.1 hypothetical protein [Sphingomonas cremea]
MSHYLEFDPRHETVTFLAAHFATQPGLKEMADAVGCHTRILARIAAERLYATGTRTTYIGDGIRLTHRVENPVGPVDDDPPPGGRIAA